MHFADYVKMAQQDVKDLKTVPFERVKASMVSRGHPVVSSSLMHNTQLEGDAKPSFVSMLLQEMNTEQDSSQVETSIRDCAAVAFGGTCDPE